jgi:hypothetical protein
MEVIAAGRAAVNERSQIAQAQPVGDVGEDVGVDEAHRHDGRCRARGLLVLGHGGRGHQRGKHEKGRRRPRIGSVQNVEHRSEIQAERSRVDA